mmetsp:Transcript_23335/g.80944  ORF Transcript_23335/g.80944 Transcript_23335/m.80944 type:complete len:278 (+) Transcript_23335:1712-2545(+)
MALCSLQVARRPEDGDDGAHAVVVVRLGRELLRAQLVRRDDLHGHGLCVGVAHGVQDDLADHGVVGDHHGHGTKEHLQVVRELGAASVTGVHRDERAARHLQRQVGALEHESLRSARLGLLDGQNLLRDDRQHLELDAIKFVEAGPRARRRQALEELAHGAVVEAVGAVEDDALLGQRLCQILGRLRLARARGPFRRAAEVQMDGAHERAVAAVRERRDHQAAAVADVLVGVEDGGVDHLARNRTGLARLRRLALGVPVVPELRLPVKVRHRRDSGL